MHRMQAAQNYGKNNVNRPRIMNDSEREALIIKYAPLVKFLANRMSMRVPPSVTWDDLISAGIKGLLDAIDRFDPSREVKFKTYAKFRIKGAMLDELRNLDWVPRSTREKIQTVEKAIISIEAKLGRPADDNEIAEEIGVNLETYYGILNKAKAIELLHLDEYVRDDKHRSKSKKSYHSLIQGSDNPTDNIMALELKGVTAEAIKSLSKKEQMVISLYYYDELTLKEIGEVLGLTESRISQIHTKAIIKLRVKLKSYYET